jgi:hypothetical protein
LDPQPGDRLDEARASEVGGADEGEDEYEDEEDDDDDEDDDEWVAARNGDGVDDGVDEGVMLVTKGSGKLDEEALDETLGSDWRVGLDGYDQVCV